jgi:hypothetical protein
MAMKQLIEQYIMSHRKKILDTYALETYVMETLGKRYSEQELVESIHMLVEEGMLSPVASRRGYGSHSRLYGGYRIANRTDMKQKKLLKELRSLHPSLSTAYYEKNPDALKMDLKYIQIIDSFLKQPQEQEIVTIRQRSFWLFQDDSFLSRRKGQTLMQRLQITCEDLRCYQPQEPFAYAPFVPADPINNILILENGDTFHLFRTLFREGKNYCGEMKINMLIFGDGDKIAGRLDYFREISPFVGKQNHFFYFGDLSYDRFHFLNMLQEHYPSYRIRPFVPLYKALVTNCAAYAPYLKQLYRDRKKDHAVQHILSEFDTETARKIEELFRKGRYLPQIALRYQAIEGIFARNGEPRDVLEVGEAILLE